MIEKALVLLPAGDSFMVGTAMVKTVATTKFKDAACAAVRNGDRVEVEGVRQTDGTVLAKDVEVERAVSEVQGSYQLAIVGADDDIMVAHATATYSIPPSRDIKPEQA